MAALFEAVRTFADWQPQLDDITMIVIKVRRRRLNGRGNGSSGSIRAENVRSPMSPERHALLRVIYFS